MREMNIESDLQPQSSNLEPSSSVDKLKKPKKRERSPSTQSLNEISKKASSNQTQILNQSQITIQQTILNTISTNTVIAPAIQPTSATQSILNINTINVNNSGKKEKQRPETWNKIEQQIFFNALRQNGKNFEAITQYFNTRQKRYKIDFVQRSKEQIRHFYYRTWHKIIKYISIPGDQCIRDTQVNCLIAYNALMNKLHRWNKKSAPKLVELINYGWTTVRDKGKITRLKMPICKITKHVTPKPEQIEQLPQTLSIYLEPKNEGSFCRIQKLAQNPYLCVDVQANHTIKYLISYLENKWKDRRTKFFEKCDDETETENEKYVIDDEQLVLYPDPQSHDFKNLEVETNLNQDDDLIQSTSKNQQTNANTFNGNLQGEAQSSEGDPSPQIQIKTGQNANTATGMRIILRISDENVEKLIKQPKQQNQSQLQASVDISMTNDLEDANLTNTEDDDDQELARQETPIQSAAKLVRCASTSSKITKKQQQFKSEINVEQLKCGFTAKKSLDFTLIQMYLALNKPNKIKFKYEWLPMRLLHASVCNEQIIKNEDLEKQRFYIDVLSHVAQSFLSEMKITQEFLLENRLNAAIIGNSTRKPQQMGTPSTSTTLTNETVGKNEQTDSNIAALEAKKLLDDINKSRKLRQRKPLVVKSSRSVLPKHPIELPLLQQQHPASSSSPPPPHSKSNIVLSGPVAAVARNIVNLSNESEFNDILTLHNIQTQHPAASTLMQTQTLHQNYSNIIPQMLTTLVNETTSCSSNSSSSGASTCSTTQQLHQQLMQLNDQQQSLGLDVSLLDITLNTDSVFNLNENSNMSTMSSMC